MSDGLPGDDAALMAGGPSSTVELEGAATNPRYLLWLMWHGEKTHEGLRMWDYTAWMTQRWAEWCKANNKPQHRSRSKDEHADFDAWLRRWVRREIVMTSAFSTPSNAVVSGPAADRG